MKTENKKLLLILGIISIGILLFGSQMAVTGVYQDVTYAGSVPATITSPTADAEIDSDTITVQFNIPTEEVGRSISSTEYQTLYYTSWTVSIVGFEGYGTQSGTVLGSQSAMLTVEVSGYYTIKLEVRGIDERMIAITDKPTVENYPFTNVYHRNFYSQIVVMVVTQTVVTTIIPEPITIVTTITEEGETITNTIVTTIDHTIVETLEVTIIRTITGEGLPISGFEFFLVFCVAFLILVRRKQKNILKNKDNK